MDKDLIKNIREKQAVEKEMKKIEDSKLLFIDDKDMVDRIDEKALALSIDEIKKLTIEQCNELLQAESSAKLGIKFDSDEKELEFKRAFIEYCHETTKAHKEMSELTDRTMKEIEKEQDEMKKSLESVQDSQQFFIDMLENKMKEENATEQTKEHAKKAIEQLKDTTKFDCIYDYVKNIVGTKNILMDFNHNMVKVYEKYKKTAEKELSINTPLDIFSNLEKTYLDEKYHKYNNLFMFLIIRFYANKTSYDKGIDGIFLTQLIVNLRELYEKKITAEKKEYMLSNIVRVLDLFY